MSIRLPRPRQLVGPVSSVVLAAMTMCAACSTDKTPAAAPCCVQAEIPVGVAPFTIVNEDISGSSDSQKIILRAALAGPTKRDAIYPVLHTLYRHAMKRGPFEPIQFAAEVYVGEQAAKAGNDPQMIARIGRNPGQLAPQCDNRVPYDFHEQVVRAFDASFGRVQVKDDSLDDSCRLNQEKARPRFDEGFHYKASYEIDEAAKQATITMHFLQMGKDEYVETLKLTSALGDWIDVTTSMFRKVPALAALTVSGMHQDAEVLRITTSRAQFNAGFTNLQETIAAHAAVTFQSLGTGRASDKGAEAEQEAFKLKTYKEALAELPKGQVVIAPQLANPGKAAKGKKRK